jgi:hypothetical protein
VTVAEHTFYELVSLLLGVKADHLYETTTRCRCGYEPTDEGDWNYHVAGNQADAILRARAEA